MVFCRMFYFFYFHVFVYDTFFEISFLLAKSHQTLTPSSNLIQLNPQGSIPTEIGQLSKITHLRLSSNAFTGTILEDLGRFLKIMNLADNELTGSIPEDLGRFQSLKILSLAGNKLSRSIPPTIGYMTVLEVL